MHSSRSIKYITFVCFLLTIATVANTETSTIRSQQGSTIHTESERADEDISEIIPHSNLRRTAEWMGYPRISPQPRIINGSKASGPDRYPYFVALVDDRDRMVCGGSLVASNVVLSAAHCGLTSLKFAIVGKYHGQIDVLHSEAERIPIANTYSNPRYTLRDRSYDQLLVLLETPVSSSRPVVRLNLAQGDATGDPSLPASTDRVTVLGLGQTYASTQPSKDPPEVLQEVTMGVVSNRQCQEMYDEYQYFLPSISDDMVCLLEEGKGQCFGDSGGPYVLLGDRPEDDVQIGTVAWGIDCARAEYPAVGIRTYSADDSFLRDTVCEVALNPPSYFGCPTLAPQPVVPPPTNSPSVPSTAPSSHHHSSAPTPSPSPAPTTTSPTVMDSGVPTTLPSNSPTTTPTIMDSGLPTSSPSISPTIVKSEGPSSAPSVSPSVVRSDIPSSNPSSNPSVLKSEEPSASPSAAPSTSPTSCIPRANPCSFFLGRVCCGTDICQGGFCRYLPDTTKQSGYKDDLKLTRTYSSGVRGGSSSFQSIGIEPGDGEA